MKLLGSAHNLNETVENIRIYYQMNDANENHFARIYLRIKIFS